MHIRRSPRFCNELSFISILHVCIVPYNYLLFCTCGFMVLCMCINTVKFLYLLSLYAVAV